MTASNLARRLSELERLPERRCLVCDLKRARGLDAGYCAHRPAETDLLRALREVSRHAKNP